MSVLGPPTALIATLVRLRQTLVDHDLPFEAGGVESARHERESLIKQGKIKYHQDVIKRLINGYMGNS